MTTSTNTTKKSRKKLPQPQQLLTPKSIFSLIFGIFIAFYIFSGIQTYKSQTSPERPVSAILQDIKDGKISDIVVEDNSVKVTYKDGGKMAQTTIAPSDSILKIFKDYDISPSSVNLKIKNTSAASNIMFLLANVLPMVIMIGFFIFMFRQARGAQDSVMSFGQSRAKRFTKDMPKVTFSDVAGVEEAEKELQEVVDFLKNPVKYKKLGARTPKGVLLVGPAGTGKTLLAKAVAGEASVPFFSIAGSEFMEMLVGIGAARVRDLFNTAKSNAPSIIFIDEIDAIGRSRSGGGMPGHDEREQTLNQILVEMDGFQPNEQVVVIAATNRGDILDPALLRPGRFDRRILVGYPDIEGRKHILAIHAKGKPFAEHVHWEQVAKRTVGFTGAELENMLNEAAILAARDNRDVISSHDIEEAATKVKLGPAKKRMQTLEDRKLTAYHEAGHAIVSHFQKTTDPVHAISIVSRGMALGFTLIAPTDKLHETKTQLLEQMAVMMGGRAAEELIFKEVTTGAANDFNQATRVAKAMVTEYGMSILGPMTLGGSTYDVTNYARGYESNTTSEEMLAKVDEEVKKILDAAYAQALGLLTKHKKQLDTVAEALLEKENMTGDEFEALVGTKVLPQQESSDARKTPKTE